jgi:acyl-coenzyme A thioesterase PaaI-like protein
VTTEGSLNFLDAAADTGYVYCEAHLRRCGSHLVNVDVDITDDSRKLLDCGNFTFYRV